MNRPVLYGLAGLAAMGIYFAILSVPDIGADGSSVSGTNVTSEKFDAPLRGETALEQAILDGFDENRSNSPAAKEHWLNAMAFLLEAMKDAGSDCAVPYGSKQIAEGVFDILCETPDGGRATYRVDARSGEITPA